MFKNFMQKYKKKCLRYDSSDTFFNFQTRLKGFQTRLKGFQTSLKIKR